MSNLLGELENNEAVLMLYLAGELPQEECIEVQRMLENDRALRAQYVALARLMDRVALSFNMDAALDARAEAAAKDQRAALSGVFAQWTARRLARPPVQPRDARTKTPWFFYPLGAAAAILVGLAVFWSSIDPPSMRLPPPSVALGPRHELVYAPDWSEATGDASPQGDPLETARRADALIATFDESAQLTDGDSAGLVYAAAELNQIRKLDQQMDELWPTVQ